MAVSRIDRGLLRRIKHHLRNPHQFWLAVPLISPIDSIIIVILMVLVVLTVVLDIMLMTEVIVPRRKHFRSGDGLRFSLFLGCATRVLMFLWRSRLLQFPVFGTSRVFCFCELSFWTGLCRFYLIAPAWVEKPWLDFVVSNGG